MKKNGFTLAEILVTLGIVGVVAALTLPTLTTDTTAAQIGPKLAKAVSMFEQANEALLNNNAVDTLSDGDFLDQGADNYFDELSRFLKGSRLDDGITFLAKDGVSYQVMEGAIIAMPNNPEDPGFRQRIGDIVIDINGNNRPNIDAEDRFYFSWWNDGSLRPWGSLNADGFNEAARWRNDCVIGARPTQPQFCAGHIFENNLKVLYNP